MKALPLGEVIHSHVGDQKNAPCILWVSFSQGLYRPWDATLFKWTLFNARDIHKPATNCVVQYGPERGKH